MQTANPHFRATSSEILGCLLDRGLLQPGLRADINLIDFVRLQVAHPEVRHDLPGRGRRLFQDAQGYVETLVGGVSTYRDGQATGALPGRLVRGPQAAPHRHAG